MDKKFLSTAIQGIALILIALAVLTVLPLGTTKANDMGYLSACPFAPWSTLMLLSGAAALWAVRNYIVTRVDD